MADYLQRPSLGIVGVRPRDAGVLDELDGRMPARVGHREEAVLRRAAPRHDAVIEHLAHAVRKEVVAHLRIVLLDERVARRRIGEVALPSFRR